MKRQEKRTEGASNVSSYQGAKDAQQERRDEGLLGKITCVRAASVEETVLALTLSGESTTWSQPEIIDLLKRCQWTVLDAVTQRTASTGPHPEVRLVDSSGQEAPYPWMLIMLGPLKPNLGQLGRERSLGIRLTTAIGAQKTFFNTPIAADERTPMNDEIHSPANGRGHLRVVK